MNNRSNLTPAVFSFEETVVRVIAREQEPWFVAKDIAEILGYRDAANLSRRLDDEEKGTQKMSTPSGDQEMTIINESGLYSAILGSSKPEAKRFKKWVTSEVLPAIRRTGRYAVPSTPSTPSTPSMLSAPVEFVPCCRYNGVPMLTVRAIAEQSGEMYCKISSLIGQPECGLIDGEDIFRLTGLTPAQHRSLGLPGLRSSKLNLLTVRGAEKIMALRDRIRDAYKEVKSGVPLAALPAAAPSVPSVELYRQILAKWSKTLFELKESCDLTGEQQREMTENLTLSNFLKQNPQTEILSFTMLLHDLRPELSKRVSEGLDMLYAAQEVLMPRSQE